mmetsp:Transcript_3533/g.4734  ORF Transcript_3533/g.4734 Transcript_3533/m.4734 type:complete len:315 (+) Transcript_3533:47-991(+)
MGLLSTSPLFLAFLFLYALGNVSLCRASSVTFVFLETEQNFEDAETECDGLGGNLASFTSEKDLDELAEILEDNSVTAAWIGFFQESFGGIKFSDGTIVDDEIEDVINLRVDAEGVQPNECGFITDNGIIGSADCLLVGASVCAIVEDGIVDDDKDDDNDNNDNDNGNNNTGLFVGGAAVLFALAGAVACFGLRKDSSENRGYWRGRSQFSSDNGANQLYANQGAYPASNPFPNATYNQNVLPPPNRGRTRILSSLRVSNVFNKSQNDGMNDSGLPNNQGNQPPRGHSRYSFIPSWFLRRKPNRKRGPISELII